MLPISFGASKHTNGQNTSGKLSKTSPKSSNKRVKKKSTKPDQAHLTAGELKREQKTLNVLASRILWQLGQISTLDNGTRTFLNDVLSHGYYKGYRVPSIKVPDRRLVGVDDKGRSIWEMITKTKRVTHYEPKLDNQKRPILDQEGKPTYNAVRKTITVPVPQPYLLHFDPENPDSIYQDPDMPMGLRGALLQRPIAASTRALGQYDDKGSYKDTLTQGGHGPNINWDEIRELRRRARKLFFYKPAARTEPEDLGLKPGFQMPNLLAFLQRINESSMLDREKDQRLHFRTVGNDIPLTGVRAKPPLTPKGEFALDTVRDLNKLLVLLSKLVNLKQQASQEENQALQEKKAKYQEKLFKIINNSELVEQIQGGNLQPYLRHLRKAVKEGITAIDKPNAREVTVPLTVEQQLAGHKGGTLRQVHTRSHAATITDDGIFQIPGLGWHKPNYSWERPHPEDKPEEDLLPKDPVYGSPGKGYTDKAKPLDESSQAIISAKAEALNFLNSVILPHVTKEKFSKAKTKPNNGFGNAKNTVADGGRKFLLSQFNERQDRYFYLSIEEIDKTIQQLSYLIDQKIVSLYINPDQPPVVKLHAENVTSEFLKNFSAKMINKIIAKRQLSDEEKRAARSIALFQIAILPQFVEWLNESNNGHRLPKVNSDGSLNKSDSRTSLLLSSYDTGFSPLSLSRLLQ